MLVCKISPSARIVSQVTPFNYDTEIAEYMTIYAPNYILNADANTFVVEFGYIPTLVDNQPSPPPFVCLYSMTIILTSDDLSSWGTDDKSLCEIIANKIGVKIISYS